MVTAPVQALPALHSLPTAPEFARRLATILAGLVAAIAHVLLRHPRRIALIVPLCARLSLAAARFVRLADRLAAGPPAKPRHRAPRPGGPCPVRLPTAFGWLLTDLRHEAALYHLRLEALLTEPTAAEIIAASPAAARILRPICRMLGLRPTVLPALAPRRRPPAPRPPRPRSRPRATFSLAFPAPPAPPEPAPRHPYPLYLRPP